MLYKTYIARQDRSRAQFHAYAPHRPLDPPYPIQAAFTPGLRDLETIRQVVAAVQKPVNVVMSSADPEITARQLAEAGVKRISVGGALSRLAYAAVREAAVAMRDAGSFRWMRDALPGPDLKAIFEK